MITLSIILTVVVIVSFFIIRNLTLRNEKLEDIRTEYESFITDHPFVNVNKNSLKSTLEELMNNHERVLSKGSEGKSWVETYHDINKVADKLYKYYKSIGLTNL